MRAKQKCARLSKMAHLKIFSFIVLTSLLFMSIPPFCSADYHCNRDRAPPQPPNAKLSLSKTPKLNLTLYYDSLCPSSRDFIIKDLVKVFMEDLINIVNLRLVPWGNALIVEPNKNIICQHGPDEYNLNAIEACAINIWPDVKQHFKFIKCVENQDSKGRQIGENTWKSCCQKLSLSPRPVSDCYNSGLGRELLLRHADETNHLNPPHTFVPWLILDNQPLYKDFKNFVTYVCKAYKGHLQIKACKSLPEEINYDENANSIQPLCNASEAKKMHGSQIAS